MLDLAKNQGGARLRRPVEFVQEPVSVVVVVLHDLEFVVVLVVFLFLEDVEAAVSVGGVDLGPARDLVDMVMNDQPP